MNLLEEFKIKFEDIVRRVAAVDFPSVEITDLDISKCFSDMMADDNFTDILTDHVQYWIEDNKEYDDDDNENIENLEIEIEETEASLELLKNKLASLKNTWDAVSNSTPPDKNGSWSSDRW